MTRRRLLAMRLCGLAAVMAAGCTYPISKELRQRAVGGPSFPAALADPEAHATATVVWGGVIIQTLNRSDGSDITVLETPLHSGGAPQDPKTSRGRFIAHSPRFLDPEIYKKGLRITVGGKIVGKATRPLGEIQYHYPVVEAAELYLWPKQTDIRYHRPSYHIGFGTWYHPYWGYYHWY